MACSSQRPAPAAMLQLRGRLLGVVACIVDARLLIREERRCCAGSRRLWSGTHRQGVTYVGDGILRQRCLSIGLGLNPILTTRRNRKAKFTLVELCLFAFYSKLQVRVTF